MSPAEIHYQKALKFAKLSYWGIIFPPAGIALSLVIHSMLKDLKPTSDTEAQRIKHAERIGHWGAIVSLWPLWLFIVGFIVGLIDGLAGH